MMELPSERQLDAFRHRGDPVADEAYRVLRDAGLQRHPLQGLEQLAGDGVSEAQTLWDEVHTTPPWVDFARMEPAFQVAFHNVIPSGLALMVGSLVESYASARGAKVLIRTGRLQSDTIRRLFETAKFASDIALDRGARIGSRAWRNVVAVRLMHARVRDSVSRQPDWDEEQWGLPVNQEDYAGTLFMFSYVYRRSLLQIGVPLSEEVHAANHHVWRHVGWLMGVDEALLTDSPAAEETLYHRVKARQCAPDADSRTLAHGLIGAMAGRPPFFLSEAALYSLSRRMIGDELADAFEFPRSRTWQWGWAGARRINQLSARALGAHPFVARNAVRAGEYMTRGIVYAGLPGGPQYA